MFFVWWQNMCVTYARYICIVCQHSLFTSVTIAISTSVSKMTCFSTYTDCTDIHSGWEHTLFTHLSYYYNEYYCYCRIILLSYWPLSTFKRWIGSSTVEKKGHAAYFNVNLGWPCKTKLLDFHTNSIKHI